MQGKDFLGVYSEARSKNDGNAKKFYFVWSNGDRYDVQKLDVTLKPVDILKTIDESNFRSNFIFEPEIQAAPASEVAKRMARKASEPKAGRQDAAAVENAMREHFRKAVLRFRRPQEKEAALTALKVLAEVEEGITPEHRYMFADFGIDLRKHKELHLALAFCKRVLQLSPEDDHAYFNAARVFLDMENYEEAEQHLLTALFLAPNSRVYQQMLRHLRILRTQSA